MPDKYRPSNGTEGEWFTCTYCNHCIHGKYEHTMDTADNPCDILTRSFVFGVDEEQYPEEWIYDDNRKPKCTAHVPWDWEQDDDGNWNDPEQPIPVSPNQICLPFLFEELENQQLPIKTLEYQLTPSPEFLTK